MKILSTLITIMTISISVYSQKNYSSFDSISIYNDKFLVVACTSKQCDLFFDNTVLDSVFCSYAMQAKDMLTSLDIFGLANLYIYKDYQGDGCPEVYHLLDTQGASENGHSAISPILVGSFGNCNSLTKIQVKKYGELVEFQFDGAKIANRPKKKYTYNTVTKEFKEA